jgi:hypothetical protein
MIEEIVMETFQRKCQNKEAAMKAMDKEPTKLQKPVKYARTVISQTIMPYMCRKEVPESHLLNAKFQSKVRKIP